MANASSSSAPWETKLDGDTGGECSSVKYAGLSGGGGLLSLLSSMADVEAITWTTNINGTRERATPTLARSIHAVTRHG